MQGFKAVYGRPHSVNTSIFTRFIGTFPSLRIEQSGPTQVHNMLRLHLMQEGMQQITFTLFREEEIYGIAAAVVLGALSEYREIMRGVRCLVLTSGIRI